MSFANKSGAATHYTLIRIDLHPCFFKHKSELLRSIYSAHYKNLFTKNLYKQFNLFLFCKVMENDEIQLILPQFI